jgi:hypothetical protein
MFAIMAVNLYDKYGDLDAIKRGTGNICLNPLEE